VEAFGWDIAKLNISAIPKYTFTICMVLLHPKSLGSITLRSKDPLEHPIIEPNYFGDDEDIKVFVKGKISNDGTNKKE
jgi:choline dehydrogenase